jgi:hypothetical protein
MCPVAAEEKEEGFVVTVIEPFLPSRSRAWRRQYVTQSRSETGWLRFQRNWPATPMSEPVTITQSDFSTCELSDALLKLGVPHGGHIPDVHRISESSNSHSERLCGPAYTVRLVLASDRNAPKLLQGHFVDLAPKDSVVFISAPQGSFHSCIILVPPDPTSPSDN